ncbi:Myb-like_DNA-binding domain-containing protein [Hexamita inflata]|uniref:Myb-like DNA-binding domain-containing protein n=1 Tax=Hexamita inflata TaxID=28002 RepID=A0AA86PPB8_9EUKA|nr:Myb-like DNA-binding domain-containing protein [Hexamita inflata]
MTNRIYIQQLLEIKFQQEQLMNKLDSIINEAKPIPIQNWTEEEHSLFVQCVNKLGKTRNAEIARRIKNKTATQVASHSQKFFLKLKQWVHKNINFTDLNANIQIGQYLADQGLEGEGLKQAMIAIVDLNQ